MEDTERQSLSDAITRLPGWEDETSRRTLFTDLAWEFSASDGDVDAGLQSPETVAQCLIELSLRADLSQGDADAGVSGLPRLIEDLRERGALSLDEDTAAPFYSEPRAPWHHHPYPGLVPLEHWQAPIFFGRGVETRALLRRLSDPGAPRLQVVSGLLGCGKSSLLRAGVRARLAAGGLPRIPDAEHWLFSSMSPAGHVGDPFLALTHGLLGALGGRDFDAPTEAAAIKGYGAEAVGDLLERLLAGHPRSACWLLVIDQFEELFTAVDGDLAEEFLETLIESLGHSRLRVMATLRADLLQHCYAYPSLVKIFNQGGLYCLGSPGRASLERMILGPLSILDPVAPMQLEPSLVRRIIDDAQGQAGGLALMADVLKTLYDRGRARSLMTLADYESESLDGLTQVIARRAERSLSQAGGGARGALPRLFSHLLRVAEDGTATRRRVGLAPLVEQPDLARLIQALAADDVRLVYIREDQSVTVELAHEALLKAWPTLRHWIERRREALHTRERVLEEAIRWVDEDRPDLLRWPHELLDSARELLIETDLLDELELAPEVADFLTPKPEWLLAQLLCSQVDSVQREEIGLRLSQIGDPRAGVGLVDTVPSIHWCPIPPGEALIEGHGRFSCSAFRIAAYPVTQCQFESFLNAEDGFSAPDWWQDLRQSAPLRGGLGRHGNYPATHVSWFDAVAFCRWLSARLGYQVRLPDEWEWQWAAQSARPGFFYPWGRDWREAHANTDEGAVGRVTAVGMYPLGRSTQGAYDLAGNTWEWCRNRYDKPSIVKADPDSTRVLRGGSWRVNMGFSRADFRLDGLPEERMAGGGFRLVSDVPIEPPPETNKFWR